MARKRYAAQVELLVSALPFIGAEPVFALKGGTAINLFYRDMPRLSVDIDLTYLPLEDRPAALANVDAAFERISRAIEAGLPGVTTARIAGGGGGDTRMMVRRPGAEVKVEVSPVTRGTVFDPAPMRVSAAVEDDFGFAEVPVVAFEDLFGGKICAALDRQHPRDLYDIKLLYENEGLTDPLFRAALVYVACSNRPLHELIAPNKHDISEAFSRDFEGMTNEPVPLGQLHEVRNRLFSDILSRASADGAAFLLSMHDAEPDFTLIDMPRAAPLPAIQWKLINLRRLKADQPDKHAEQRVALERALGR
jgi:hypothetical protein